MRRDALRPDSFRRPRKAARSNPCGSSRDSGAQRDARAGLTARAAPCGTFRLFPHDRAHLHLAIRSATRRKLTALPKRGLATLFSLISFMPNEGLSG